MTTTYVPKLIKDRPSFGSMTAYALGQGRASVSTTAGVLYDFYIDTNSDLKYRKSADGGVTWGAEVNVRTGTVNTFCVWYDKWTPADAGTKIHIWMQDTNSVLWNALDTATDTLAGAVSVFAGVSSTNQQVLTGTKAKGGNLFVCGAIDSGAEPFTYRSVDAGANWTSRTTPHEGVEDLMWLFPGNYADTQDLDLIFWDASANELSLKVYDDSANSWAETLISASMTEVLGATAGPNFGGSIRHSDGHLIIVAWNAYAAAGADLKCWDINGSGSITAKTDVVTNSAASILAGLFIDQATNNLTAFYVGKSDGSETVNSTTNVYSKTSADGGTTWGSETLVHDATFAGNIAVMAVDLGGGAGAVALPLYIRHNVDATRPILLSSYPFTPVGGGLAGPIFGGLIL